MLKLSIHTPIHTTNPLHPVLGILFIAIHLASPFSHAGGVVANCTETALDAALQDGGVVLIQCSGEIVFTETKIISVDTQIEGAQLNVVFNGNGTRRLFQVEPNVEFVLRNVRLINGFATNTEGRDGTADSPSPTRGGNAGGAAIFNAGGDILVDGCTFAGHRSVGGIGGTGYSASGCEDPSGGGGGGHAAGGAIHSGQGRLRVYNCLFAENSTVGGAGGSGGSGGGCGLGTDGRSGRDGGDALGGGIYIDSGEVLIANSTFYKNTCMGGNGGDGGDGSGSLGRGDDGGDGGDARGAGIYNLAGLVSISNCTLATNSVTEGARGERGVGLQSGLNGSWGVKGRIDGSQIYSRFQSISVVNSILANDTSASANCGGLIDDVGHNLSSDSTCFHDSTSLSDIDPQLSALKDQGGLMLTILPLAGSPAIDAADESFTFDYDQRYYYRTNMADIGATEYGAVAMEVGLQILSGNAIVSEGNTNESSIRISRSGPTDVPLPINLVYIGTALGLEDFLFLGPTNEAGSLVIPEGQGISDYEIVAVDDTEPEPTEISGIFLIPSGYLLDETNRFFQLTVQDNEMLVLYVERPENETGLAVGFNSIADRTYTIESSTNFIVWNTVTNLTGTGRRMVWDAPSIGASNSRFYRAFYE